jgi:hypothetical protein
MTQVNTQQLRNEITNIGKTQKHIKHITSAKIVFRILNIIATTTTTTTTTTTATI